MPVDAIGNVLNPANPGTTQNNTIDQNDFIKLFLSQLQFQDPLEPVDNREFLAQLAQFSSLEKLTSIETSIKELSAAFAKIAGTDVTSSTGN